MTAEELAAIAGVVVSLAFSYIPKLKGWYDGLGSDYKRLVMAGVLLVVSGAIFGLSCYGVIAEVECTQAGALGLVKVLLAALVANQSAFSLSPKRK